MPFVITAFLFYFWEMKKTFLSAFLFSGFIASSQTVSPPVCNDYNPGNSECISDEQRAEIKQHLAENIAMLQAQGKLPTQYPQSIILFDWPLRLKTGLVDYGYHSISGQVDHDPNYPNQLLDYNCGTRTYDTPSGYNHQGTDYFLWPFDWNKMDSGDVEIIAAAPGTIIYKSDGNFDRSCGFNSNNWNAVYVQHSDGSVAWYGHMKNGSLTTKTVGQTVALGEFLGKIGSSGNSTGPHLHLEIYDAGNNLIDPYAGTCNNFNVASWWINQRPYVDAAMNHIATNFTPPVFNPCSQEHTKNERDFFTNTDTIFLMMYYRFFSTGDSTQITIYRPDNSVWGSWWDVSTWQNYNAAYLYYWAILGSSEPTGQWKFEAVYKNQVYFHNFWIGLSGTQENNLQNSFVVYPSPSSGIFNLKNADEIKTIEVYNTLGEIVYSKQYTIDKTEIDLSVQPKGIYFVKIISDNKVSIQKIIIE